MGEELPATSYIPQPPCDGKLLSIEAWGLAGGSDDLANRALRQRNGHCPAQRRRLGLPCRRPSRDCGRIDLRPIALRLSLGRPSG